MTTESKAEPTVKDLEKAGCTVTERSDGYKSVTTPDGVTHQVQEVGHLKEYLDRQG
jgi:hypothetical protein